MKRPLEPHERMLTSQALGARLVAATSLAGILALGTGCSGEAGGASAAGNPLGPAGSDGAQTGTGQSATGQDASGQDIAGQDAAGQDVVGQGTTADTTALGSTAGAAGLGAADTTGQGGAGAGTAGVVEEDPNAIPASAPPAVLVPTPRVARLSRTQWSNAVRDLLQLTDISDIDADVSGDALTGFDSQADALFVTEQLRKELADASEKLADRVTGDAAALARLVPTDAPTDIAGRARAFVTSFGLKAFRRPLTDAEVTSHQSLFDQGPTLYPGVDAFEAGASLVIQAMLQSPHFLYRTELGTAEAGATAVPLNDYEVASKLAFALTNTMPDTALFTAAAAGELQDRTSIAAQAQRLLDSPEGGAGISNFNFQVYRLGTYDGITRDPAVFPEFTPEAPAAMREEVLTFFNWIFSEDLGVKDFYTSPVGFVNSALAPIYGLDGTFSSDTFTKVDLDPSQRAGFLTQAGFLASYASGADPDIIHRGVFIATRLLCVELPPPAPNAGPLIDLQPDMTNRQRVEATTGQGTCGQGCHSTLLNPLGYAFENYDAIGKYRTDDRGLLVDAASSYTLDGATQSFSNGVELSHLLSESKQLHGCYAQNMMSYLHGRPLAPEDDAMIDYYARLSRAGMISVQDLELDIVTSDAFLTRLP